MEAFQKGVFIGLVGIGIGAGGCAKVDPNLKPPVVPTGPVDTGETHGRTTLEQRSFHDYSIPLNLTDVRAEIVCKQGKTPDSVVVPEDFSSRAFLKKIVSGGQTGVDRAALDFGLDNKIAVGGWCPKDRYAEDGPIAARYPLTETEQAEVTFRTEFNVRDSDGSLVLVENHLMRGTGYTREMAIKHEKPYWIQPVDVPFDKDGFARWLIANDIKVLNIGGPRESDQPGSVYDIARALLEKIID